MQRWFIALPEEERLEEYLDRWQRLLGAVDPHRDVLGQTIEQLAQAERRVLLGVEPEPLTPAQREARLLELVAHAIARFWWRRPCPSVGDALLPAVRAGAYFDELDGAVHLLDLEPAIVAEALAPELKGGPLCLGSGQAKHIRCRHRGATPRGSGADDEREGLHQVIGYLRDRLRVDPVSTVCRPLFSGVLGKLTSLAHRGPSSAMRRWAAEWIAALTQLLRPDFRSHRTRRRPHHQLSPGARARRRRGEWLLEEIQESQSAFARFCGAQDQANLPWPLRAHTFEVRALEGVRAAHT